MSTIDSMALVLQVPDDECRLWPAAGVRGRPRPRLLERSVAREALVLCCTLWVQHESVVLDSRNARGSASHSPSVICCSMFFAVAPSMSSYQSGSIATVVLFNLQTLRPKTTTDELRQETTM